MISLSAVKYSLTGTIELHAAGFGKSAGGTNIMKLPLGEKEAQTVDWDSSAPSVTDAWPIRSDTR